MLAEQGKIGDLVKQQMQPSRKRPAPTPATPRGSRFVCKVTKVEIHSNYKLLMTYVYNALVEHYV